MDEIGYYIAKGIAIGLLMMILLLVLFSFVYNISGEKEREENQKFDCLAKGGEMIYIRGTGNVCIKGIIKLER